MTEYGTVLAVNTLTLGGVLAADAPAGATELLVEDAVDFSEDGGQLTLAGQVIEYTTADDDTGIITLAASTAADAFEGDRVEVWDQERQAVAVETLAQVAVEGANFSDDPLEVSVDHALIPYLPEGTRTSAGELVELAWAGSAPRAVNVLGAAPAFDGGVIDPATLPPAPVITDGLAPVTSPAPTVLGGVGVLHVRWAAAPNTDPLTYEVHVSAVDGFTPDPTTLAAETPATATTVRALPDGTPLASKAYDANGVEVDPPVYYVRLVAKDADGTAPASAQTAGSLYQVTNEEISSLYGYFGDVLADQITSGTLNADVTMSGLFKTGDTGQRVEIGAAGVSLIGADESPRVTLPTDPALAATFAGEAQISSLTMTGMASLRTTDLQEGAALNLQSSLQAPLVTPNITVDYEFLQWDDEPDWWYRWGWSSDGTSSYTFNRRTARLEKWSNSSRTRVATSNPQHSSYSLGTCVYGGGWVWLLQWSANVDHWTLSRWNPADLSYTGWEDPNIGPNQNDLVWDHKVRGAGIGYDSSTGHLLFSHIRSSSNRVIWFRAATWTTSSVTKAPGAEDEAATNSEFDWNGTSVLRGTFDHGTRTWIATARQDATKWYNFRADDAATVPTRDWGLGFADAQVGMYYTAAPDSAAGFFRAMTATGKEYLYKGGDNTWSDTDAGKSWQAAYTWRSATAQTTRSPAATFTMSKRARVRISSPGPYPAGGPDGAKFYLRPYSTNNALGTFYYQGENLNSTPSLMVNDADFATATKDPLSSTFAAGTPALIDASVGNFQVRGDSSGAWGPFTFDAAGNVTSAIANYRVHARRSAAQNIPDNTPTRIQHDLEIYDPMGMHANGLVTIPATGVYTISASAHWNSPGSTTIRTIAILVNGEMMAQGLAWASAGTRNEHSNASTAFTGYLNAGDTVETHAFHQAGSGLSVEGPTDGLNERTGTRLSLARIW